MAKCDKQNVRELLPFIRSCTSVSRGVVDQRGLVNVMVLSTSLCTEEVWAESTDACNMNVKTHVSFSDWLKRIEAHLQGGATFKCEAPIDRYWLLPSIWHDMLPEKRQTIVNAIDRHNGVYAADCVRDLKASHDLHMLHHPTCRSSEFVMTCLRTHQTLSASLISNAQ